MTQRPSGWYDDPEDPDQLRYWDGILWSDRVMSKVKPGLENSHIGAPQRQPTEPDPGQHPQDPYRSPGRQPYPQQRAYVPLPVPMTPDGQRLSGWWRRVLALIIDNILVFVVAAAITYSSLSDWISAYQGWVDDVMTAMDNGSQTPAMPDAVLHFPWQTLLANLLLYAVYEILLVTYRGQTVGKMVTGIRVRRATGGGNPSLPESALRFVVKQISLFGGLISVIGSVTVIFTVVDYLAPLFDRLKRAIHDRAARTYVVRTAARTSRGRPSDMQG